MDTEMSDAHQSGEAGNQTSSSQDPSWQAAQPGGQVAESTPVPFRLAQMYPVIGERLYFTVHASDEMTVAEIERQRALFFFSSDLQERYEPFCADFGPVNLAIVFRFLDMVAEKLNDPRLRNRKIVYYCDPDHAVITNTCFLLGAYLVLEEGYTPAAAFEPFRNLNPSPIIGFRDATYCPADYLLGIEACLSALYKATRIGFLDIEDFDLDDYEYWDHPHNGDMHQICNKFIAFKGPTATRIKLGPGVYSFTPNHYVPVFRDKGVTAVIRLNEPETYERMDFVNQGVNHYELYFDDCTVPTGQVLTQFLDICDQETGIIAIHCKAGLGRTGTLIAIWIMRKFNLTADEVIAWLRIVRPGSVIGPQQAFLRTCEDRFKVGRWEGNRFLIDTDHGPVDGFSYDEINPEQAAEMARQVAAASDSRGQG